MFSEVMAALGRYVECIETKCKKEQAAYKEATKKHKEELAKIRERMLSGKASPNAVIKRTREITEETQNLKESKAVAQCGLDRCRKTMTAMLDIFLKNLKNDYKTNKNPKLQEIITEIETVKSKAKNNTLTVEDFQKTNNKFMSKM
jgi:phosphoenolpyruvate-protein kinase (PTS system EI component)